MRELLRDPVQARRLGDGARRRALERFNIRRFARDWDRAFEQVAGKRSDFQVAVPAGALHGARG